MTSDRQQGDPRPPFFSSQYSSFPIDRSAAPSPFRIDEGFSEESQTDPDVIPFASGNIDAQEAQDQLLENHSLRGWLLTQPVGLRAALARDLLASVPNSVLSGLVTEANARLHFDPIRCLPQEIVSYIFEFLDHSALLNASLVSRLWTSHANEPRLWKRLFALEGWSYDPEKICSFQDNVRLRARRSSKPHDLDEDMLDVEDPEDSEMGFYGDTQSSLSSSSSSPSSPSPSKAPLSNMYETQIFAQPSTHDTGDSKAQPNWKYLYKHRRRLEQNWIEGRFKPFRLPHPDYPSDAHRQCVYTLQFSSKYVVSGSRDKTVRVWDLKTQRLKYTPLIGHDGSVLCVQFDERPQHDIVASGSSDADVIIWRFSTGYMIKRLRKAHAESVLNLRFDHRYLVTCSKDKTIKVWNRRELLPTDPDYPQTNRSPNANYPQYIVDVKEVLSKPRPPVTTPLMPFTLLMTLNEHSAAVNAIQIQGNEIVSASGDRKIILWDIPSGKLVRTFMGHSKGIACVQYDGRRIISGSSDHSVRIFDRATAAEVAVLEGHRDLVRTVQADFGDIAGDGLLLEAQAKENDRRILEDKQMEVDGKRAPSSSRRNPRGQHFVFGAKLPPSGGGNRWSKIVSGSYDETVIIWRKDKNGQWVSNKELRQEDAIRATAPVGHGPEGSTYNIVINNGATRLHGVGNRLPFSLTSLPTQIFQRAKELGMPPDISTRDSITWIRRNLLIGRPVRGVVQFYRILRSSTTDSERRAGVPPGSPSQTLSATLPGPLPAHLHPDHPHFQYQTSAPQAGGSMASNRSAVFQHVARQLVDPQIQDYFQHQLFNALHSSLPDSERGSASVTAQASSSSTGSNEQQNTVPDPTSQTWLSIAQVQDLQQAGNNASQTSNARTRDSIPSNTPTSTPNPVATMAENQMPPTQPQPQQLLQQQQQQPAAGHNQIHAQGGFSRLFKLQFDSRRIVCCSQQPVIVGWDFANGDRSIEEASQFFGGASW